MGVDHLGGTMPVDELMRQVRQVAVATIQNAAVGRAGIRVYDGGWIRIEGGGLSVTGTETVSGTLTVTGHLNGSGDIDWTGPSIFRGTVNVVGNMATSGTLTIGGSTTISGPLVVTNTMNVTGNSAFGGTLSIQGATTLNNDLTVGTGRIVVGNMVLDKAGAYGGRIASGSGILLSTPTVLASGTLNATSGINSASGDIVATLGDIRAPFGDIGGNTKSFWIEHPTKPGKQLRHGSLEGPEHGVYYRGVVEFDDDGEAVFELPDYFTALVLEDDEPTVQVTPIGRPFLAGSERVSDGHVVVYGEQNREAHVTVTAARGLFDVEPDKEPVVTDLP